MASAKNAVIAGDYEKCAIGAAAPKNIFILKGLKQIKLNHDMVESYEVMNAETSKSATSAVGRGLVGNFLLGPIGIAAALSAKNKGTYVVAIQFKDGKKSLIELDDKKYKILMAALF